MLSIHSGGEIPWEFGIEGITDDNLPVSIRSALLEVVTIGYSIIIVAGAAGPLRTVRNFTIDREGNPIESLQNNLFMGRDLGGDRSRIEQRKKQNHQSGPEKFPKFFRHLSFILESGTSICQLLDSIC